MEGFALCCHCCCSASLWSWCWKKQHLPQAWMKWYFSLNDYQVVNPVNGEIIGCQGCFLDLHYLTSLSTVFRLFSYVWKFMLKPSFLSDSHSKLELERSIWKCQVKSLTFKQPFSEQSRTLLWMPPTPCHYHFVGLEMTAQISPDSCDRWHHRCDWFSRH